MKSSNQKMLRGRRFLQEEENAEKRIGENMSQICLNDDILNLLIKVTYLAALLTQLYEAF